jgi:hypothetical protein
MLGFHTWLAYLCITYELVGHTVTLYAVHTLMPQWSPSQSEALVGQQGLQPLKYSEPVMPCQ